MNIARRITSDGACVLTFDRAGSSANVFDAATLAELDGHLSNLEGDKSVRGLILSSAKPKIFVAGADLHAFAQQDDEHVLLDLVENGQRVFQRLALLRIPTIAAIHGACLGGGLEMALACDWRVASLDAATRLGLPETQLGILPAWGGSTRLPRLLGLARALGLILTGKQVPAAQALKLGLVDDVAHPEQVLDVARALMARGKRRLPRHWVNRPPLSWFVAAKAKRDVRAKTRGHYPAPVTAIQVATRAARGTMEAGFAAERAGFAELVRTPACRNLMRIFFLQERAKKLSPPGGEMKAAVPRHVAVIGAGTMGAGIAQWISARGLPVRLKDVSPEALARGLHAIDEVYAEGVKRRRFTRAEATAGLDRVWPVHADVPLPGVGLVIEAALEQLDVKRKIFRELEARVAPGVVLATNTSALSIDAIADGLARPERVVGLHFFNPVHRMQLLEIVHGRRTSAATLGTAVAFAHRLGKLPVVVRDSPGFLVNRILLPYMIEAVRLFQEGSSIAAIDRVMLDFGMPMGPLRLADEVGLDVAQHVAADLASRLPGSTAVPDTLERMLARGWRGRKSGRGFHVFEGRKERPLDADLRHLQSRPHAFTDDAIRRDRMVLVMVNEAARVLAEGVVESADDVDFGMIMGTGWAPFRGGPLRYADALGLEAVVRRLEQLAETAPRFAPCELLREMARTGRLFHRKSRRPSARSAADAAEPHTLTPAHA